MINILFLVVEPPEIESGPNAFQAFVRTSYTRVPR